MRLVYKKILIPQTKNSCVEVFHRFPENIFKKNFKYANVFLFISSTVI